MALLHPEKPKAVFVTGGAGFIGSHVVELLVSEGRRVTAYDNLSTGNRAWVEPHMGKENFRFVQADLQDLDALLEAMPGHDLVWHLGANADIPAGVADTGLDLGNNIIATRNVLEAMRRTGVRDIIFASTGAVYGDREECPIKETAGPLLPVSLYGASKLACEALISAYCHLFGLRAWIFRFGNVVGGRMVRGVIHDFILKLHRNPDELEILGDGRQTKNYFLVEECIEGMLHAYYHAPLTDERPCDVFNLGAGENTDVVRIADIVMEEMGLPGRPKRFTGGKRGWPGDQPRVFLDIGKMESLGWRPQLSSDEAVRIATRRMLEHLGIRPRQSRAPSPLPRPKGVPVCVVGLYHLGPVLSACFAQWGHTVVGVDPDPGRVASLARGMPPVYEPGLEDALKRHLAGGRLRFTTDFREGVEGAEFVWLAFDITVNEGDEPLLEPIYQAVERLAPYLAPGAVLVVYSPVPVGTTNRLWERVKAQNPRAGGGVAYVVENLRLGQAFDTFLRPDVVVIGADDPQVATRVERFLAPVSGPRRVLGVTTAEMVKHAINSYLSTSISLANELGRICDLVGADGVEMARTMRMDGRISPRAPVLPGLGFAGGTLARDLRSLQGVAQGFAHQTPLLDAVLEVNRRANRWVVETLERLFPSLSGLTVAVLGLTYTPNTSTLRRSVALETVGELRARGVTVRAFDPRADLGELGGRPDFIVAQDPYDAAHGAHALAIMTAWPQFRELDFSRLREAMARPLVLDARNLLTSLDLGALGFEYLGVARGHLASFLGGDGR